MELSPRILAQIARDFPGSRGSQVVELLTALDLPLHRSPEGDERICGAILIFADGDIDQVLEAAALAELDWRDLLVSAGVEHDDWRTKLTASLVG